MKKFALIGAAGFVAPRHMKAILDTGNQLVAALDRADSVGIIDSYFPQADFFTEFERFDRHLDKLRRQGTPVHYVSICSPNYLHDSHIRFGLRQGAHVICEKPLVLNPWNLEALQSIEAESGHHIYSILQLRLHPVIQALRQRVLASPLGQVFDLDLTYIASRGNWYYTSWKGDLSKSGGIATNIGIHFFDMLTWVYGQPVQNLVHLHTHDRAAGYLELEKARVRWFLSINPATLPPAVAATGQRTFRSLTISGEELEFSEGFTDLHTRSYEEILAGNGFGLAQARAAIQIVQQIRQATPMGLVGEYHPFAAKPLSQHPFLL
ncbi:MAG: Gfo/Idh/MocA family oxidoreductase [Bernardetiaceae bacterium]|jgi:UDP-N-acetyl-2-amino-2-deoxyglucuronate dehydrogenase|nr:Gfo/Idh/MocA family oxidoreductase [Bernardetiaceae bacterium]